jgi:1-acyl-sn-glycerol-3-phosphate acyltransferase
MIKKKIATLLVFIIIVILTNIIMLPCQFIGLGSKSTQLVKSIGKNIISCIYTYGYESKIKINGEIKNPDDNKINIIIGNHISSLDWGIVLGILDKFNITDWYYVIKRSQIMVPSFGTLFGFDHDIKVKKNWLEDQEHFEKQIDKIKTGNIIIFPAGTRFTKKKHKKAIEFSKKSNIPVYNNLLVPRTKGLWKLISYLNKKDRLANIYDFTFVIPKYLKKELFLDQILESDLGDTYAIIKKIQVPEKKYLDDMNKFKEWIFKFWMEKDNSINNIGNYDFIEYNPELKGSNYILIIFCMILTIYLITRYKLKYIGITYLLSYLVIYCRNYI